MPTLTNSLPHSVPARRRSGNRLLAWWDLYRQRRHLAALDPRMLRDLGLSADEAHTESTRAVWDAPAHWLK